MYVIRKHINRHLSSLPLPILHCIKSVAALPLLGQRTSLRNHSCRFMGTSAGERSRMKFILHGDASCRCHHGHDDEIRRRLTQLHRRWFLLCFRRCCPCPRFRLPQLRVPVSGASLYREHNNRSIPSITLHVLSPGHPQPRTRWPNGRCCAQWVFTDATMDAERVLMAPRSSWTRYALLVGAGIQEGFEVG